MEAGVVLAVAAVVTVVLVVVVRRRARGRRVAPRAGGRADSLVSPEDLAELDAMLGRAEDEERHTRDSLLISRLDVLVAREIPVRRVTQARAPGAATVGFADGTAVTVASRRAAEAGVLLMHVSRSRVLLRGYRHEDGKLVLSFSHGGAGRDLEVVALGLDQPS